MAGEGEATRQPHPDVALFEALAKYHRLADISDALMKKSDALKESAPGAADAYEAFNSKSPFQGC